MAQQFNLRDFRQQAGAPKNQNYGGGYSAPSQSSFSSGFPSMPGRKSIFDRNLNMNTVLRMTDLPSDVQNHLVQVYSSLMMTLLAAAAGAYTHMLTNIGGMMTGFACMGLMMLLMQEPKENTQKRLGMLLGFGFFKG
jgi:hypothetical protein